MNISERKIKHSHYHPAHIALRVCITLLFASLLFFLRYITFAENEAWYGADGWYMANLIESQSWQLYYRSLLAVLIHNVVYTLLHPVGVEAWYAIAFSTSLAGAVALQALYAIRRDPVFLAVNVLSGSFLVFVGHVENYAWVNAFLILAFWQAKESLLQNKPLWPAITFYCLACLSHMLAIFYIPAIIYFVYKKKDYNPLEILLPMITFLGIVLSLSLLFSMLGTDVGFERLVPLFHKTAKNHHFTFFSWDHFEILFYFHRNAAFLGIPIELPLLIWLRKQINTDFLRFMLICVICGLFWTTIWHPDWGRKDWDLFSQFGIPLHILVGYLLSEKVKQWKHWQANAY